MDREFGLIESFNIDNGELDGLTPQEVFVLGYQLASISVKAELHDGPFHAVFNAANWDRIEVAMSKRDRHFNLVRMPGDLSENWCEIFVDSRTRT